MKDQIHFSNSAPTNFIEKVSATNPNQNGWNFQPTGMTSDGQWLGNCALSVIIVVDPSLNDDHSYMKGGYSTDFGDAYIIDVIDTAQPIG